MHKILAALHTDHARLNQILGLLQEQSNKLSSKEKCNFFIMAEVIDYIHRYFDQVHHPKEDIVYKVFLARSDEAADVAESLSDDHQTLLNSTLELQVLLENIVNIDAPVDREELGEKINDFIALQTDHINLEEITFFPLINATLLADDWSNVEETLSKSDGLFFDEQVINDYKHLSQHIKS